MSIFSEAFSRAGVDTDAARLAVAATNLLTRSGNAPERAIGRFAEMLQTDAKLLHALALGYLRDRAADMSGRSLIGGGQCSLAFHCGSAPANQSVEGDEGQGVIATASSCVPSSPSPKAEREGQQPSASAIQHLLPRSAPVHDWRSRTWCEAQASNASPVVKPPSDLAIAARLKAAQTVAQTVMDTYLVRGGIAIGDLGWKEAKELALTNEREARVLRYVTDHVANARPGALVREVVKPEVIEDAIRFSREAENVAA